MFDFVPIENVLTEAIHIAERASPSMQHKLDPCCITMILPLELTAATGMFVYTACPD